MRMPASQTKDREALLRLSKVLLGYISGVPHEEWRQSANQIEQLQHMDPDIYELAF
jgi:hypothetical protein